MGEVLAGGLMGGLASGAGGKKGDDGGGSSQTPFESAMYQAFLDMYNQTGGARQGWINEFNRLMTGKYKPEQSPLFAPMYASGREGIENQFQRARESVGSMYRGGQRESNLANLEALRAGAASELQNRLNYQNIAGIMDKSFAASVPSLSNLLGTLSSANMALSQRQLGEASITNQDKLLGMSALGQLVGKSIRGGTSGSK